MNYKNTLLAISFSVCTPLCAQEKVWISMGADASHTVNKSGGRPILPESLVRSGVWVGQVEVERLAELSHNMHEEHHRCGGYMVHPSPQSAMAASAMPKSLYIYSYSAIS